MAAPPPAWERQPTDTIASYRAFCIYRDDPDLSLKDLSKQLGKKPSYLRVLETWSSKHNWVKRRQAWQDHLDEVKREETETLWAERGRQYAEDAWATSEKMLERAQELTNLPLYQMIKTELDEFGENITNIYEPLGWRTTDIIRFNKEAFALREKALESQRDSESGDGLLKEFVTAMREAYEALPAKDKA